MALPSEIFVDTGAWYALFDRRDRFHTTASRFLEEMRGQAIRLVTSEYVFSETVTLLRYRCGHSAARAFGEHLRRSQVVCEEVNRQLREAAWQIFLDYEDQVFSFTNCVSCALMRTHSIQAAFSFDHHFQVMGFTLRPGDTA